ncbi:nuclear transport factor 2 family protein [Bacillus litorisediminis]|uniref:nuclear transport factor 2 family protein n=1 Tax=Bacillus litorisediminis TaxID=2922713 RepID=UPI001FAC8036|nr:nuclear transport factor 2 family protein [Bacillus litorisediminis]
MENNYSDCLEIKVIAPADCGNSPRKFLLKDMIIAFARNDIDFITKYTADNVCWNIVGFKTVSGINEVIELLQRRNTDKMIEINIHTIITHGKTGAVNGILKSGDSKAYEFCNVYHFISTGKNTIKEITSYVIQAAP